MAETINLALFSYPDEKRDSIQYPWTRGSYSYATDGRILVRAAADPEWCERADAPNADKVLDQVCWDGPFYRLDKIIEQLPPRERVAAIVDGNLIDVETVEVAVSVSIGGAVFAAHYLRLAAQLPDAELGFGKAAAPHGLRFDGGIGALMGMRDTYTRHIAIALDSLEPQYRAPTADDYTAAAQKDALA
ncbi:MAG: hypothetical protein IT548_06980 [Alphaproteobacteria bacterium]|nr:hypothetical protein [Alphaproteobacteria bacterium]